MIFPPLKLSAIETVSELRLRGILRETLLISAFVLLLLILKEISAFPPFMMTDISPSGEKPAFCIAEATEFLIFSAALSVNNIPSGRFTVSLN